MRELRLQLEQRRQRKAATEQQRESESESERESSLPSRSEDLYVSARSSDYTLSQETKPF